MTYIFIYFLKQSYNMTLEDLECSVIISNTYYRTASYAHQGSIYLIKNIVKYFWWFHLFHLHTRIPEIWIKKN